MSIEQAASVLVFVIFAAVMYVTWFKMEYGRWPKVRNPFF